MDFVRNTKGAALIVAALGLASPSAADAPQRVVSMNLCTDQLAMMVAAPGQLLSVSHIARDPLSSAMAAEAAAYPVNHGGAEEIYLLNPDLVLAGKWSDPVVLAMLRRLGVRVVQFDLVNTLDQVGTRLREMGAALGRAPEAEARALAFQQDLTALASGPENAAVQHGAFFYPNGYTLGPGTLSDEILRFAGLENIAESLGLVGGGTLSLEHLVVARPELVIRAGLYPGASRSEEIPNHPALAGLQARAHISDASWTCGTPHVIRAIRALREAVE